jgi:hypothetical protein
MDRLKAVAARFGVDVRRADTPFPTIERVGAAVSREHVEEVFAFFDRVPYFYDDAVRPELKIGGAWRAFLASTRKRQIELIERRDAAGYAELATRMLSNELVSGLYNYSYTRAPTAPAMFTRHVRDLQKVTGLKADALAYRNPLPAWGADVDGHLVTYVSPAHTMQAWSLGNLVERRSVVVDLGSGFGGMAEKLLELKPEVDVVLVDIPANLSSAYLYLAQRFQDVKLCARKSDINVGARILLVPTLFVEALAEKFGRFDVVNNSGSFSEMDFATIDFYMRTLVARARYLVETNSNEEAQNAGHTEVVSSRFPVPPTHRLLARFKPFDADLTGRYLTSIYGAHVVESVMRP